MTDIYAAVMKAADHIERNPQLFDFMRSTTPECGTPGCVLGWVAHFMGAAPGTEAKEMAKFFGLSDGCVWFGLDALVQRTIGENFYHHSHEDAARFLRTYAAKYLAPPKPAQPLPDWQHMVEKLGREPRHANTDVYSDRTPNATASSTAFPERAHVGAGQQEI
jgi:hypothetical protein